MAPKRSSGAPRSIKKMLDRNKHQAALYRLLTGLLRDTYLASMLGFKGGTACYFFHDLPRFSVDLDFDITASKDSGASEEVFRRVKDIIEHEGFTERDA